MTSSMVLSIILTDKVKICCSLQYLMDSFKYLWENCHQLSTNIEYSHGAATNSLMFFYKTIPQTCPMRFISPFQSSHCGDFIIE
uniref:Secreted protein n=1 Tax=Ascaris lumbricoides TaxID=6252 RepID=A0A0M3IQ23_ASCLU